MRIPTHGSPTHPGEMLEKEFLEPLRLTQSRLAELIGVPFQRVNKIVNQKQSLTIDTAIRLARLFNTTPQFWLNLQHTYDLYHALHSESVRKIRKTIKPLKVPEPAGK